jgi:hypothetical protein
MSKTTKAAKKAATSTATTTSTTKTAAERAADRKARNEARKVNPCLCGCGTKVAGNFKQGHDQRVRGILQRVEAGTDKLPAQLAKAIHDGLVIKAHALKVANQPVLADAQ